ncbi:polysialyltransferase family glycosyltransferase [Vibrio superstes]|nr:polysialyltransferase family glycosyltransferase [Vibrio superstes]
MNIAIVFTPMQSLSIERILSVIDERLLIINLSNRNIVGRSKDIIFGGDIRGIVAFFAIRLYIFIFRKKIGKVYLSHPYNHISNWFYYSSKVNEIILIEDGLANYYLPEINNVNVNVNLLKRRSFYLFYEFKVISNLLIPNRHNLNKGYFYSPKIVMTDVRTKMPINYSRHYLNLNKCVLFLDQDISHCYNENFRDRRNKIESELNLIEDHEIFVKLHPAQTKASIPLNKRFTLVKGSELTAEELILKLKPKIVYSYHSTALINIKREYPNIICRAVLPEDPTLNNDFIIRDLFNKFGVDIL